MSLFTAQLRDIQKREKARKEKRKEKMMRKKGVKWRKRVGEEKGSYYVGHREYGRRRQ
jgi:hypothetical protein